VVISGQPEAIRPQNARYAVASESPPDVIAIAADHGGYRLKTTLAEDLRDSGRQVLDLGTNSPESVDYPTFGKALAEALLGGRAACGVLVCGTGIGMEITANRFKGIRAANCYTAEIARLARQHNNANVLVLGGRFIDEETARQCLHAFLETEFEGGRHQRRVAMLDES
jgi:ribose 5-phosphate isomerase B